jgi:regulator of cell morphogenesis and NO signaling
LQSMYFETVSTLGFSQLGIRAIDGTNKNKRKTDMAQLNLNSTVGEWVAQRPQTSRVFEALRIDYCCGGGKSLDQACREEEVDPQDILGQLQEAVEADDVEPVQNWAIASLSELCDHIEQTHHAYLRTELPRLTGQIEKVINAHGSNQPELEKLGQTFAELRAELEPHMFKEEKILFPAIRQLERSETQVTFPFGTVANPIRMMEHEHDNAANALATIRRVTDDYRVPGEACNTYRAMLDGLSHLERDLHRHIHKENSILFPRAQKLEQDL